MRWKRYMKYSNGTYKNAGQDLIFQTEMPQDEIIRKLEKHEYFLRVNGIKRFPCSGILSAVFRVEFLENKKKYIIIRQHNNFQILYSSGYEAEIFEFMVKKLNCIPQESINKEKYETI